MEKVASFTGYPGNVVINVCKYPQNPIPLALEDHYEFWTNTKLRTRTFLKGLFKIAKLI
jgi:hypothetical protein